MHPNTSNVSVSIAGPARHADLTIVGIYGHSDGTSVIPSLLESLEQLPGSKGLVISTARPKGLPDHIQWKQTGPLDYYQYSVFCMYALQHYIETGYCLIVQDDGWVLNGSNFTDVYYEYDYVGAPCHLGIQGDRAYPSFSWTKLQNPTVIQNGGFSLRSRKFLQAPSHYGIIHKRASAAPFWNEDVQLTGLLRPALEAEGVRFAPNHVAKQFAVEYLGPDFHNDLVFDNLVGHHAESRKLISHKTIACTHSPEVVSKVYREMEFLKFLQSMGYRIEHHS